MAQPLGALSNGELWDLLENRSGGMGQDSKSIVLMRRLSKDRGRDHPAHPCGPVRTNCIRGDRRSPSSGNR